MIKRLISGGQTGADFAGLQAARDAGIPTGGTAPKGWRICLPDGSDGSNPKLADFGLVEHESPSYPPRTRKNVADSHGTVWFGFDASPGAKTTFAACRQYDRPLIINPSVEELKEWIQRHHIEILNCAGNRESDFNPGIFQATYSIMFEVLSSLHSASFSAVKDFRADVWSRKKLKWLCNLDVQAVTKVSAQLAFEEIAVAEGAETLEQRVNAVFDLHEVAGLRVIA